MIPTTQAIIDAIEQRSRTFKARWLKSLDPVEELSCNIMSLTVTTGGGGETPVPGALFSSYVNCTVMNLEENIKGFEFYLQIGVVTGYDENDEEIIGWLPSNGKYTIIQTGVAGERTEFMAAGAITAKCQKAYTPTATGYPKTIRAVLNEIQTTTGCTITIKSPLVGSGYIQKPITGQTCASALSVIASLLGGFVTEDYQGNIVLAAYGSGSTYPVDLTRFSTRPVFTEDPFIVTGLFCDVSEAYEISVDVAGGGGYSYDYQFISDTAMTGRTYNGLVASLRQGVYETGDTIGFSCSWEADAWYYDSSWDYQEPFNSSGVEDVSFTYGTAATEEVAVEEDEDTGIKVILRVVYDGVNTIHTQTVVTIPLAKYRVGFGISTGPAHYYVQRYPAVNYSYGTPNITIQNEYMTQALFNAARQKYVGYTFTPATLPLTLGNPRLEPWDILEFTEGEDSKDVPCHMLITTFTGGLWQDVSSLMAGASDDGADPVTSALSAKIDHIASASQIAQAMATAAQTSANDAATFASSAQASANTADQAARFATRRADDADREATRAGIAANEASGQAQIATRAANGALNGLSTVQDVIGALEWAKTNAEFALTDDTELEPGKTYWTLTATAVTPEGSENPSEENWYTNIGTSTEPVYQKTTDTTVQSGTTYYKVVGSAVANPVVADLGTYYEISGVDEAMADFINTHLALTDEGLYVLGGANQWKVLIAPDGVYIIDGTSGVDKVVAKYKDVITLGLDDGTESYQRLDYHSLQLIDKEGDEYFWVSDLRYYQDIDGDTMLLADITEETIAESALSYIKTSYTIFSNDINYAEVKVNGSVATISNIDIANNRIYLGASYAVGDVIETTYKTESPYAKAYTIGTREDGYVGPFSIVVGRRNTASGMYSYAEGFFTTASGDYSHSEGWGTTASHYESHAEGNQTTASGNVSHSEGYETTASGPHSHAEGDQTTASGGNSHAEGMATTASGDHSHAEGYLATASGQISHAEGYGTIASGDDSHAQNNSTVAAKSNQTAIGKYNVIDTETTESKQKAFIIGNGTGSKRSNAFSVDWDGDAYMCLNKYQTSGNVDKTIYDALNSLGWLSDCTES